MSGVPSGPNGLAQVRMIETPSGTGLLHREGHQQPQPVLEFVAVADDGKTQPRGPPGAA